MSPLFRSPLLSFSGLRTWVLWRPWGLCSAWRPSHEKNQGKSWDPWDEPLHFFGGKPHVACWLVVWNHGIFWLFTILHDFNIFLPELYDFPYIGNSNPNWRTPSFFRGVGLNHQPAYVGESWIRSRDGKVLLIWVSECPCQPKRDGSWDSGTAWIPCETYLQTLQTAQLIWLVWDKQWHI